jgi:hypothetical protein
MKCSCKLLALVMATMLVVGVTPSGQVKAQATPQDLAPAIQFCGQSFYATIKLNGRRDRRAPQEDRLV